MEASEILDWAVRLLLAGALGAVVGAERELRGHPAGVRTQALVALAAALFTGVGSTAFSGAAADPTRIAAGVATGIGFIGAGVILHDRGSVRGLTTAATLWLRAALGVAGGAGAIIPAAIAALFGKLLIHGLTLLKPLIRERSVRTVVVDYEQGHGTIGPLLRNLQRIGCEIEDLRVDDDPADEEGPAMRHVRIKVAARNNAELAEQLENLARRPEVVQIRMVDG